jgi:hypothetical protein
MTHDQDTSAPLPDVIAEARRILDAANREQVTIRLLGGVAIALLAGGTLPSSLRRTYGDIDVVISREHASSARALLERLGYVANRRFNNLHGAHRLLYYDEANTRQLDVFVGAFKMCHELDLGARLLLAPETLPPADLLLTKLQIVEINRKDLNDTILLLHTCAVSPSLTPSLTPGTTPSLTPGTTPSLTPGTTPSTTPAVIDLERITSVTSKDWGWHTTLADNLARIPPVVAETLAGTDAALVLERVEAIRAALEQAPKSLGWKMRAGIGRRMPWYELPEEVGR